MIICTLQMTTDDGESIEIDFNNEDDALMAVNYIKQCNPINLESIDLVKPLYSVDDTDWDTTDPAKPKRRYDS